LHVRRKTSINKIYIFVLLFAHGFDASVYSFVVDIVTIEVHVHLCICMQNNDVTAVGFQCGIIRDRI
jgi:hypothetical protein